MDRNKKINRGHVPLEREAVDEVKPLPANKIKHNQIKPDFRRKYRLLSLEYFAWTFRPFFFYEN